MRVETVLRRIDSVELRMQALADELRDLRKLVAEGRVEGIDAAEAPATAPVALPPVLPSPPPPIAAPTPRVAPPAPAPAREHPAVAAARREPWKMPDLDALLGARALAWAGGVVTLLGVLFLFVLAANRGWIGPVERVALGALASALVFAAGIVVHRRYGQLYASLGAVGAGIAGGYATLLAATALYELIPAYAALPFAAAIAAAGVVVAIWWSAEMIAGLGLIGAMLSPVAIAIDDDVTALGTFFAAVVYAATAVLAVPRRWDRVLVVGAGVSAAEAGLLMLADWNDSFGWSVAVVASFWLLYLATGVALHLREREEPPVPLVTTFLLGSATFAVAGALALLDGDARGVNREGAALLFAAAVYGGLAAWLFRTWREVSAVVSALALALCAIGLAFVFGGPALTIAWAAEAALLAWLAQRLGEARFQIGAVAYLALAVGHALTFEAQPRFLFQEVPHPGEEAYVLLAIAAGAAVFARYSKSWPAVAVREGSFVSEVVAWFVARSREWHLLAVALVPASVLYAAALGLLELHVRVGGADGWEWGHVSVAALWGAAGALALVVGARRASIEIEMGGILVLAAAFSMLVPDPLGDEQRGWVAAVVAGTVLAGSLAHRLLARQSVFAAVTLGALGVSGALAGMAVELLLAGDAEGTAYVVVGAAYGVAAALAFARREREGSTVLWGAGLVLAFVGSVGLLEEAWLVLAWSAGAAALAGVAAWVDERRLQVAAVALLGIAGAYTLVELAPPIELVRENASPAGGVPALVFVLLALVAIVAASRRSASEPADVVDDAVDRWREDGRVPALWVLGTLGVYAASLALLGAFQELGGSVATDWQRGHVAVSAMWGVVGLGLLYVGLRRAARSLRLAGFALLGVSLAKIFLYDLSTLSSVARALSFLAVGAVFLLGAFFYQRLSGRPEPPDPAAAAPNS